MERPASTIADGIAVRRPAERTLAIVRRLVDDVITVTPLRTFPIIRDLVTDVSFNYAKARELPAFAHPSALHLAGTSPDGRLAALLSDERLARRLRALAYDPSRLGGIPGRPSRAAEAEEIWVRAAPAGGQDQVRPSAGIR